MLIGVDHGNKQIKTVHCNPFVSGLKQSVTRPFGQNVLRYQNTYYTLSTERIPYRKDKTEDDRFFILTLFALAGEIEARGAYSSEVQRIQLAVGLPPAHFGAQVERFTQYFRQRGVIEFEMQGKPYSIYIEDAACFPQAYAAAATMLHTLVEEPKAVILDIGGFTADYLLMKNGEIDLTSCDSLENGVILLYNKVRSKVNSELDLLLDEGDVDAILMGKKTQYPDAAIRLTEQMAQEFINDLFSTLRERMLDLQYCKVVFVGGGAILLKRQIETSGKVGTPFSYRKSMQMRMAMSICTGLKQQAGDGMGEKKERGRFTLRFNEGDPIHETAIGLLELQSPRTKAQYVANAVVYYNEHFGQEPQPLNASIISKEAVVAIVKEILRQEGMGQEKAKEQAITARLVEGPVAPVMPSTAQEVDDDSEMDDRTRRLIAGALSAFRSRG